MMISPTTYGEYLKDADYLELIKKREELLASIREFEAKEIAGDRSGEEWSIHPQPDVRYQMDLEYLGELCRIMHEKYNNDYVWGDRTLKDDVPGHPKDLT